MSRVEDGQRVTGSGDELGKLGDLLGQGKKLIPERPTLQDISDQELPTDLRSAYLRTQQYDQLLAKLSPELRQIFLNNEVKACVVGVKPIIGLGESAIHAMTVDQKTEARTQLANLLPDLVFVYPKKAVNGPVIANIAAVTHVIQNNKEVFPPEASADPRKWLTDSSDQWFAPKGDDEKGDQIETRWALLTGVPLDAAKHQRQYRRAKEECTPPTKDGKSTVYRDRYLSYADEGLAAKPVHREMMKVILDLYGDELDEEAKRLLLEQTLLKLTVETGSAEPYEVSSFVSFDVDHDNVYIKALQEIFEGTRIAEAKGTAPQSTQKEEAAQKGVGILDRLGLNWFKRKKK